MKHKFNALIAWLAVLSFVLFTAESNPASAQSPTPTPFIFYLPQVSNAFTGPPAATSSRYMSTVNATTLYNEGCAQGASGQNGIVVLDFGAPRVSGGVYGSLLFGTAGFVSTASIKSAATWFLQGYWNCSPANAHVVLGIGTSNCGNGAGPNPCNAGGNNITSAHGQAWAQMVRDVNTWITSAGYNSKMSAAGANDMEPSWDSPTETKSWVGGYFSATPVVALYNYGSCDSCPYFGCPTCTPNNGWSLDDIWYVSWGATAAYPLPEIYLASGANADQWYRMGVYSYTNHGNAMNFQGSFTQWQACQDAGPGACPYTGNTPATGWTQLFNALGSDPRTSQPLNWSTDITWQN